MELSLVTFSLRFKYDIAVGYLCECLPLSWTRLIISRRNNIFCFTLKEVILRQSDKAEYQDSGDEKILKLLFNHFESEEEGDWGKLHLLNLKNLLLHLRGYCENNSKSAVRLSKFDYRLSNKLGTQLQRLRCIVNYHALTFTNSIVEMGKKLVGRMGMKSKHFIALHLRFEPDMLVFSGCDYGGGEKERIELGEIRKRWKTLHVRLTYS